MSEMIFSKDGVELFKRGSEFFARYDAGHLVTIFREDKVSEAEAAELMRGGDCAHRALLKIQRRLEAAGINPYASNMTG